MIAKFIATGLLVSILLVNAFLIFATVWLGTWPMVLFVLFPGGYMTWFSLELFNDAWELGLPIPRCPTL